MIQYLRDIIELLRGSGSGLSVAFVLTAVSLVLDVLCMALLPWYLLTLQSASHAEALSQSASWLPRLPLLWLTVLLVTILLVRGIFLPIQTRRLVQASEQTKRAIAGRLALHYMTAPYEAVMDKSYSHMLTVIGSYTDSFAKFVVLPILTLLLDVLTILVILAFISVVDPLVVPFFAGVLLIAGLAYYYSIRGPTERHAQVLAAWQARFHHHMIYSLRAPREVRVLGLHDYFVNGIQQTLEVIGNSQASLAAIRAFPRAVSELTVILITLAYMAYKASAGTPQAVVISQLSLLAFAALRILPSFVSVMVSVAALRTGRHAARLLLAELRQTQAPRSAQMRAVAAVAGHQAFVSLELRNVSFQYQGTCVPALTDVNLIVRRGQSVGVMGPSGAGKSTLADLILGLLQPTSGTILINGEPIPTDSRNWWKLVGFVPQMVNLADDTLIRNIAFGVPDAEIDRQRVERAAEMAQLADAVSALPHNLDTLVGDQGVKLSGGQRQRVAIARALYHEREFLVLDEATSALDSQTEQDVVRAVASLRNRITTFIIAHRRSTLEGCDSIIELREGRIQQSQ